MEHILIGVSLILFLGAFFEYRKYKRPESWVEEKVEIINIELEESQKVSGNYVWNIYFPVVRYGYTVGNETQYGSTISLDKYCYQFTDERKARELIERIKKITVASVNPQKITESVLIPELVSKRKSEIIALAFAGVIVAIVWIFLVVA